MKICVYGCGAIGGLLAARLAAAGNDVSVIARGAQLQAIQSNGLTLLSATVAEPLQVAVTASEQPADLGAQDLVLLTMKAHAVPAVAARHGRSTGRRPAPRPRTAPSSRSA